MKKLMKKHPLLEEKKPKKEEPIETGKTLGGNTSGKTLGNEDKTLGRNTTGDNTLGGEKGKQPIKFDQNVQFFPELKSSK
jgi:hypothetical protein